MRTPIVRRAAAALSSLAAVAALAAPARADDDELPALSIYGFLRLDTIVSDSTMSDPVTPRFVPVEPGDDNPELAMHARLSRIGLSVDRWQVSEDTSGEGQVEIDFLGGDHGVRLRHAWAALHPTRRTEILIGQTWDLVSPLYPLASPATHLWDAGNTGGFRPQLRLTHTPTDRVRFAAAIAGAGGPDGTTGPDLDADGRVDAVEGGLPMAQFLLEVRERVRRGEPARIGAWGHVGRDELASGKRIASYSIGGHLYVPIVHRAAILVEVTHGRDLAAIGGGLGQGANPVRQRGIRGTGGWIEATVNVGKKLLVAEGVSVDTVRRGDVEVGDRRSTIVGYVALRLRPHATVEVGVEGSYWTTTYKAPDGATGDPPTGRALRANLHAGVLF